MRKFGKTEQEVIKYIVSREKIEEMCFSTLFLKLMLPLALERTEKGIKIYYKKTDGKIEDLIHPYTKQLLDILFVIKYLDDNSLIGVYHLKDKKEDSLLPENYKKEGDQFYEKIENKGFRIIATNTTEYYTDFGDLLFNYIYSCFHASETLRELVKNDFKDEDTIQFEKSMSSTRQAIRISLVVGVASIIIGATGIWLSWKSLNQPSSFPTEKLEEIKTELQNISSAIKEQAPVIINPLPKQDTSATSSKKIVK